MEERTFSMADVLSIFKRRARLMIFTAGSIFLVSVVIAATLKDKYQAYTTLLVEPQSISKRLVEGEEGDADVISRLHLMTMQILSRARLSKVIDEFNLYPELSESKTREEIIGIMRSRINVEPVLPDVDPELKRTLNVQVNTFRLFFSHDNPGQAAAVANRLSNDFIDEHIRERVQSSGDTADFIESELQRLTGRIRELDAQIAQVKNQGVGSLPEDLQTNQRQVERAFDSLALAQRSLAEAQSDEAFYRQQATLARESGIGGGSVRDNSRVLSPAQRLQQLENDLGEYRAKGFTDKHPDVIAASAELEQVRQRLASGSEETEDRERAPTSIAEQNALAEMQRANLRAQGHKAEIERYQKDLEDAHGRLAATPRVAEQLDALRREYDHLAASIRDYSNKRLEASVAANMERRQKGEQFRVLEPAFSPPSPTYPNRPLILVLGVLIGVAASGGLAFLLDAADSSFHDPRALQRSLRIPVLAAIPSILLDADRARIRMRHIRDTVAAATVAAVVLAGSLVGYVVVNRPNLLRGGDTEAEAVVVPAAPAATATPAAVPSPLAPPLPDDSVPAPDAE